MHNILVQLSSLNILILFCNRFRLRHLTPPFKMPKRSPRLMIKSTRKYAKYLSIVLMIFLALIGVFCTVFSKIFVNRFIDSVSIILNIN